MNAAALISDKGTTATFTRTRAQRSSSGAPLDDEVTTIKSGASVWIQPLSDVLVQDYAQRDIAVTHALYCATSYSLREGDIVTANSRTFAVVGHEESQAGLGTLFKTLIEEKVQ